MVENEGGLGVVDTNAGTNFYLSGHIFEFLCHFPKFFNFIPSDFLMIFLVINTNIV